MEPNLATLERRRRRRRKRVRRLCSGSSGSGSGSAMDRTNNVETPGGLEEEDPPGGLEEEEEEDPPAEPLFMAIPQQDASCKREQEKLSGVVKNVHRKLRRKYKEGETEPRGSNTVRRPTDRRLWWGGSTHHHQTQWIMMGLLVLDRLSRDCC